MNYLNRFDGKCGQALGQLSHHLGWGAAAVLVVKPLPDAALIPICFIGVARLSYKFSKIDRWELCGWLLVGVFGGIAGA